MSQFERPNIAKMQGYTSGEQPQDGRSIKLNTNENPYPPSPSVAEAVAQEVSKLQFYPEPTSGALREAIGVAHGYSGAHVIIGNGSDNILDLITRCFVESPPGAGHTVPSYSLYPVVAGMSGQALHTVPFDRSMELNVEAIINLNASVFFLTNPNAPTGVGFPRASIEAILKGIDGLLVLDEAYVDFGGESALSLLKDYDNLIVVRTFSKSYGLAEGGGGFGGGWGGRRGGGEAGAGPGGRPPLVSSNSEGMQEGRHWMWPCEVSPTSS